MPTSWNDYLSLPAADKAYRECQKRCAGRFEPLRAITRRVVEALKPESVACLGAGVLNDIPYRTLVRTAAEIHLVDWLPGAVEAGITRSILVQNENGLPGCVYCTLEGEAPGAYCIHFKKTGDGEKQVCDHFEPGGGDFPTCEAFEKGKQPAVRREDITGGFATAFGEEMGEILEGVKSWKQAFRRADALAKRVRHHHDSLGIGDGSIDLVTSSMVVSQFEHEPYGYFAKTAREVLGFPSEKEERRLKSELDSLRSKLLVWQVERHLDEIERILAPEGRCFMAFEVFHFDPDSKRWFLVKEMHHILGVLGQRFDFDFDILPAAESCIEMRVGSAPSVVQAFVLRPKAG